MGRRPLTIGLREAGRSYHVIRAVLALRASSARPPFPIGTERRRPTGPWHRVGLYAMLGGRPRPATPSRYTLAAFSFQVLRPWKILCHTWSSGGFARPSSGPSSVPAAIWRLRDSSLVCFSALSEPSPPLPSMDASAALSAATRSTGGCGCVPCAGQNLSGIAAASARKSSANDGSSSETGGSSWRGGTADAAGPRD